MPSPHRRAFGSVSYSAWHGPTWIWRQAHWRSDARLLLPRMAPGSWRSRSQRGADGRSRCRRSLATHSSDAGPSKKLTGRQPELRGRTLDSLIFTDAVGRPMRPEGVSAAFQKAREAASLPRVRFHDLRHSAATLMLAEGVPLAVISEWLGHAGIAITAQHYAAVVPQLRRDAADALDRALQVKGQPKD
jgi:integrase